MDSDNIIDSVIDEIIYLFDDEDLTNDFIINHDEDYDSEDNILSLENRGMLSDILEPYVNSHILIKILLDLGLEDMPIFDEAISILELNLS